VRGTDGGPPRLLLVGGGGGLVGRAVLTEFRAGYRIRSVHRRRAPSEDPDIEWVAGDVAAPLDWDRLLADVDVVLNVAWYRWESEAVFRGLYEGLRRLLEAARRRRTLRFLHVSVPSAPASLETGLPYLRYKRRFDAELAASELSFRIVRPTLLYGPGDRLLGVMLRLMARYRFLPMFGPGDYHVSPVASADLARVLQREAASTVTGTVDVGGPESFRYRDLTDLMFRCLDQRPHYWRMSLRSGLWITRAMVGLGSSLLYPYEVEWLVSDRLSLPPYRGLDPPMQRVRDYLAAEAGRVRRVVPPGS
jgi:uncharacterized protein YbjT (DUF2867 family)